MANNKINLRYATALYELAEERGQVEQTFNDVQLIAETCRSNKDLRLLFKSPVIFTEKKLKIISEIFKDKIGKITMGFMEVLTKKRREEHLEGIANSFISIYREAKNIKVAEVTTAVKLDDEQRLQLMNILTKQTKSEIILEEIIDPSIVGGVIVRIEGVKFDDSVKSKIQALKQEFNVNTYIKGF